MDSETDKKNSEIGEFSDEQTPKHIDVTKQSQSLVERIVNKGPFPKAETELHYSILNIAFYSSILPVIGYVYIRLTGKAVFSFPEGSSIISTEILVLWIAIYLFFATFSAYYAGKRIKKFFTEVEHCLDLKKDDFDLLKQTTVNRSFKPPILFAGLIFATTPFLMYGVTSLNIYAGDYVISAIFGLMLIYSNVQTIIAGWMLFSYLKVSHEFGRKIPVKINPFDPDRLGGLAPLSDLSTLAILFIGMLSLIIIPIWQIFLPPASYVMILLTSVIVPLYFLFSMRGVYEKLREEKEKTLSELNNEIQTLSKAIRVFISEDHSTEFKDKEITMLGQSLNATDIIYERIKSMHTFPVNWEIMAKLFVSAILPILWIIVSSVLSKLI